MSDYDADDNYRDDDDDEFVETVPPRRQKMTVQRVTPEQLVELQRILNVPGAVSAPRRAVEQFPARPAMVDGMPPRSPRTYEPDELPSAPPAVRTFETGANRDLDTGKLDFEGFVSPIALEAFGLYMHKNRHLRDGSIRDSDNWQKGIPLDVYMKSGWRHFYDWWRFHRGLTIRETFIEALCGLMFNLQGYLHEYIKANPEALESFRQHVAEKAKR